MLWELGVRDARPQQVEVLEDHARWPELMEVERCSDRVVLRLRAPVVDLKLVPLVELVQVLDAFAR